MADPIVIKPQEVGSTWACPSCSKRNGIGIYPALHMREGLTHTCECGLVSDLRNWKVWPRTEAQP